MNITQGFMDRCRDPEAAIQSNMHYAKGLPLPVDLDVIERVAVDCVGPALDRSRTISESQGRPLRRRMDCWTH